LSSVLNQREKEKEKDKEFMIDDSIHFEVRHPTTSEDSSKPNVKRDPTLVKLSN
jgi:hypothetical protein